MSKLQLFVILAALFCFLILYFGFDIKAKNHSRIEQACALNAASTDIRALLKEAKATLTPGQSASIESFEQAVKASTSDKEKVKNLKLLSGTWFEIQKPEVAGFYAEEVANITQDETSWAITGTTYAIALQRASSDKVKDYVREKAVSAFEHAISINPENLDHQINLAVCYTDHPLKDNPMKGVLMLIDLNKKHPEDVGVLTNLGRLGIKTGQFEKAVERLEKAIDLQPDHRKAYCLLTQAYEALGQTKLADMAAEQCRELNN